MNIRKFFLLAATLAFAACSHISEKTLISGYVNNPYDQIRIICGDIDTLFYCENAEFSLEIPVDITSLSTVASAMGGVGFISDGSRITVDFRKTEPYAESDANAQNASFVRFQKEMYKLQREYSGALETINHEDISAEERAEKSEKALADVRAKMVQISRKAVKANKDNATALVALGNLSDAVDPDELLELIDLLDPSLRESEMVVSLLDFISVTNATAEGRMFKDFATVYEGETRRFSDYVGKGKYILVDFWASWCAPCKAEMPNLREVYEKYHGDRFDMLSVAVWDEPAASIAAAAELGITWNQMINAQQVPTDLYGIEGIPHIILFGPDGTILKRNLRGSEIGKTVGEYLK